MHRVWQVCWMLLVFMEFSKGPSHALATEEYTPPTSPPLYVKEDLTPPKAAKSSGLFGDAAIRFGSASQDEFGAGAVREFSLRVGYFRNLVGWARFEPSFQIFTSNISFSGAELDCDYGFLAKVGYGRSLGSGLWGVTHFGAGLLSSNFSFAGDKNSKGYRTLDASWGSLLRLGYDISLPSDGRWVFSGGFVYDQYIVSVGEVVYESDSKLRENINKSINIRSLSAKIGVLYNFSG